MRIQRKIPKTDVIKFGKEVLDKGAAAVLPKNLPDRWLKPLVRDIVSAQKAAIDGREGEISAYVPWIFLAVMTLLSYKKGGTPQDHSEDEFLFEVQKYKDALVSELVARQVGVNIIQYDLIKDGAA